MNQIKKIGSFSKLQNDYDDLEEISFDQPADFHTYEKIQGNNKFIKTLIIIVIISIVYFFIKSGNKKQRIKEIHIEEKLVKNEPEGEENTNMENPLIGDENQRKLEYPDPNFIQKQTEDNNELQKILENNKQQEWAPKHTNIENKIEAKDQINNKDNKNELKQSKQPETKTPQPQKNIFFEIEEHFNKINDDNEKYLREARQDEQKNKPQVALPKEGEQNQIKKQEYIEPTLTSQTLEPIKQSQPIQSSQNAGTTQIKLEEKQLDARPQVTVNAQENKQNTITQKQENVEQKQIKAQVIQPKPQSSEVHVQPPIQYNEENIVAENQQVKQKPIQTTSQNKNIPPMNSETIQTNENNFENKQTNLNQKSTQILNTPVQEKKPTQSQAHNIKQDSQPIIDISNKNPQQNKPIQTTNVPQDILKTNIDNIFKELDQANNEVEVEKKEEKQNNEEIQQKEVQPQEKQVEQQNQNEQVEEIEAEKQANKQQPGQQQVEKAKQVSSTNKVQKIEKDKDIELLMKRIKQIISKQDIPVNKDNNEIMKLISNFQPQMLNSKLKQQTLRVQQQADNNENIQIMEQENKPIANEVSKQQEVKPKLIEANNQIPKISQNEQNLPQSTQENPGNQQNNENEKTSKKQNQVKQAEKPIIVQNEQENIRKQQAEPNNLNLNEEKEKTAIQLLPIENKEINLNPQQKTTNQKKDSEANNLRADTLKQIEKIIENKNKRQANELINPREFTIQQNQEVDQNQQEKNKNIEEKPQTEQIKQKEIPKITQEKTNTVTDIQQNNKEKQEQWKNMILNEDKEQRHKQQENIQTNIIPKEKQNKNVSPNQNDELGQAFASKAPETSQTNNDQQYKFLVQSPQPANSPKESNPISNSPNGNSLTNGENQQNKQKIDFSALFSNQQLQARIKKLTEYRKRNQKQNKQTNQKNNNDKTKESQVKVQNENNEIPVNTPGKEQVKQSQIQKTQTNVQNTIPAEQKLVEETDAPKASSPVQFQPQISQQTQKQRTKDLLKRVSNIGQN